jgi:hypothetical protein
MQRTSAGGGGGFEERSNYFYECDNKSTVSIPSQGPDT